MPGAEFKDGIISSYDSNTQAGIYKENNTNDDRSFETVKPVVNVNPGQSVSVLYKTPSGKEVNIAVKIDGKDV